MTDLTLRALGSTMRALRFHGCGDLRLDEIPVPQPKRDEVRLRPLATGICGTDVHIFRGEFPAPPPVVLGHEVAGIVDAVGADVTGLKEGDLATLQPNTFCGQCRYCRTGREHLCPKLWAYGVHGDGGFAEALVASAKVVYRLPATLEPRIGCMTEPLACCVHGMDKLAVQSGSTVLVIGAGLIGLILTRLARLAGAGTIVSIEPIESRRNGALGFGADAAFAPDAGGRQKAVEATLGQGFDFVIDAVGSSATFDMAVEIAGRGASILVFGCAPEQATSTVRPYDLFARELTIMGSFINPYTHERAVQILPQMGLEKLPILTFPLGEYQKAFANHGTAAAAKLQILPQV